MIFDTGAIIGFERGKRNVAALVANAVLTGTPIHVPTVVVAEAWRGGARSARQALLLAGCREDMRPLAAHFGGLALVRI